MNRLLVICGPTATGKTDLAVVLAEKFNGEIVSADSRHVYKGMDVITGKDLPSRVPVWLVDIISPDYIFNVAEYSVLAHKTINDIWLRKKLPIVVGGTGFYIRSIIDNIETAAIPPDKLLRSKIEKYDKEQLQKKLIMTNPERWEKMNASDRENPRRLIRAIEIASYYKKNKESVNPILNPLHIGSLLMMGLHAPADFLFKKIDHRVEKRMEEGALEEVKELLGKNYSPLLPALSSTGFRQLYDFLQGKERLTEAIKSWKFQEHRLALRQMTWFKKEKRIQWFDISKKNYLSKLEDKVRVWYNS